MHERNLIDKHASFIVIADLSIKGYLFSKSYSNKNCCLAENSFERLKDAAAQMFVLST